MKKISANEKEQSVFVCQKECEERRKSMMDSDEKQNKEIAKLYSKVAEMSAHIENLVSQNKWFLGVVSAVLCGLLVFLLTR